MEKILDRFLCFGDHVSFYYKELVTGKEMAYNADKPLVAASVIKIPVLLETLIQIVDNRIDKNEAVVITKKDKMPSCGALTYMHDNLSVTVEDLYTLMIILSDNTATNLLIQKVGIDNINATLRRLGLEKTTVNRLLFDAEAKRAGKENLITAREMGKMLELIYNKEIYTPEVAKEMERVLKLQRLNGKIPYLIEEPVEIAHKTGEDTGITHDVGIVYAAKPFIICFASNGVDVLKFELLIQEISLAFYKLNR